MLAESVLALAGDVAVLTIVRAEHQTAVEGGVLAEETGEAPLAPVLLVSLRQL